MKDISEEELIEKIKNNQNKLSSIISVSGGFLSPQENIINKPLRGLQVV